MSKYIHVLTIVGYRILKSKGADLTCRICGKPLKPGDKIIAKQSSRYRRYHYPKCSAPVEVEEIEGRGWSVVIHIFCRRCGFQKRYKFSRGSRFREEVRRLKASAGGA